MTFDWLSPRRRDVLRAIRPIGMIEALEPRELLALVVANVQAVEGVPRTGVAVATFNQGDVPGLAPTDFLATINWGDGGPTTNGSVSFSGGIYTVQGNYTYRTASRRRPCPTQLPCRCRARAAVRFPPRDLPRSQQQPSPRPASRSLPQKGVPFGGIIANFTDADLLLTTNDFTATIQWGDGTTSSGLISTAPPGAPGSFDVQGQVPHVYTAPGVYNVLTTISHAGQSTVALDDCQRCFCRCHHRTDRPNHFSATANEPISPTTIVGTFTYNSSQTAPVFSAVINWGDGHTTLGSLSPIAGSNPRAYNVLGGNTYIAPGNYTVNISVQDQFGDSGTIVSVAVVLGPVLSVRSGTTIAITPGVPFAGVTVGTFSDSNPLANMNNITADINWGDGHLSNGKITGPDSSGLYSVTGGNTYANGPGPFTITVNVADPSGLQGTIISHAIVSATINVTAASFTFTPGVQFTKNVATFTDSNPLATSSNTSALIRWGDGSTSDGTIAGPDAKNVFTVSGTYTYQTAPPGTNYPVMVTITDPGGTSATATSKANVTLPKLTAKPINITATPGVSFTTAVATFADSNPQASANLPTALISWGDGFSTAGTVTGPNGNGLFTVTGTYQYFNPSSAANGLYHLTVTITDPGGLSATVHPVAYVPAPVLPAAVFTGGLSTGGVDTNTDRPTFKVETTNAFALVRLFARAAGVDANPSIGQTIAGADGRWSLTVGPLAQGVYTITAIVTPPGSSPSVPFNVGPSGRLIIDTTSPKVVGVSWSAGHGQVDVFFRDDLSGMSMQSLTNPNRPHAFWSKAGGGPPGIRESVADRGLPTDTQGVVLNVAGGLRLRRSLRSLRIAAADITDNAGNTLGNDFRGPIAATAYGRAGSNFVVKLNGRGPGGQRH